MDQDLELHEYLDMKKKEGMSNSAFARLLGVHRSVISKIKNYQMSISPKLAMKIEEKSEGKVKWWKIIKKFEENQEKRC